MLESDCSCREPKFGFQHLHHAAYSHHYLPALGNLIPSAGLHRHWHIHDAHMYMFIHAYLKHKNKFLKRPPGAIFQLRRLEDDC